MGISYGFPCNASPSTASSDRIDDALRLPAQSLGPPWPSVASSLVYGGGSIGLMGEVARAAKANGGRVHGVITERLRDLEQGWGRRSVLKSFPTCVPGSHA